MTSVDWEEVKKLAAGLQRVQLISTTQRLSERNCVEIVTKLLDLKLLDVIFTTDGKEYVTPQQLLTEMKDELYVHGGRINLVELATILNVDLSHITQKVSELLRKSPGISLVLGQLIDRSYTTRIAEEINETLILQGQVSVDDLTRQYDLPSEFLQQVIERNLGKIIRAKQDPQDHSVFFTEAFVARNKASIRGALAGVTRPISVSTLLSVCGVEDRLFFSLFEDLLCSKQVPGVLSGKQSTSSIYVPSIYSKSQSDWVENFYRQNGFLEYSALARIGISDGQSFAQKRYSGEKLLFLNNAAVGRLLLEQVEAAVEEAVSSGSWVDIMPLLPTVLDEEDAGKILVEVLKTVKTPGGSTPALVVFKHSVVCTESFLNKVVTPFKDIIQQKAEQCVASGVYQQWLIDQQQDPNARGDLHVKDDRKEDKVDKREERRKKAAGGKGGGGTQGRETKTKSTKKKHRGGRGGGESDDEDIAPVNRKPAIFELLTVEEISSVVGQEGTLSELDEDDKAILVEEIAKHLHLCLNKSALAEAQTVMDSNMASHSGARRKTHSELQEKLNNLITNVRLFERGLKSFSSEIIPPAKESAHSQLSKYLLKTFCTDIANEVFGYVAQEQLLQWDTKKEITHEARQKLAQESSGVAKDLLLKLNKVLMGASIDDFLVAVEAASGSGVCDVIIRKPDKKKERNLVFGHRQALLEQLNTSQDPAQVLHIACLVLFQGVTQTMLHASGRYVNLLLAFLRPHLPADTYSALQTYYDLVLKLLTVKGEENDSKDTLMCLLQEKMQSVKDMANTFRKSSGETKE